MTPVESVHHKLMCAGDKLKVVHMIELLGNVLPEGVPSTSGRNAPACAVIWVRPEQVAHGTLVRNLLNTV
jgi:hypothetical protein